MKKLSRFLSLLALSLGLLVAGIVPTYAATNQVTSTGNGLKISPVRTDLTITPGTSQSVTINVTNVTSATTTFQATVNDFVAGNDENGQPALILGSNQYAPSHSLKRYIAPIPNITIGPNDTEQVKVTINIPKDAAGGGYFGAVRFAPASGNNSNSRNVTLSASVGSLILVKVPGDIKDNLTIASFDVRSSADANGGSSFFTTNKSLYSVVRFQNQGNVQEQPFGKVILKKGSKVLQTTEINNTDPRGNILPDSIRRFSVQLDKVGSFGKYTVEGNFGYANGQLLSATTSFYVVPVALIVVVIIAILIVLWLIFGLPRTIRRYNQRVLRKAGRR